MDRPEPGLVKWSSNANVDAFVHISLQHRVVQLYEPTGYASKGNFQFKKLSRHDDFPPLTTYDWSPTHSGLLAVGTGSGIVNLLRIDDQSNGYMELGLKMSRTCQAVAFNTTGLLAVGLDRVRMDQSLHVWDVERLSRLDDQTKGFPSDSHGILEPRNRLEPSVSVSSIKFFEDSPQTLVAGIRAQGLRIHDLREPGTAISFQTKCNNNLAIDYADQNYFASSALDHPGVMIWDRRCTSRAVASHVYLQAIDEDELPWGGALRLDRVIQTDLDPWMADSKHSLIRSLRYCRDRRGLLAVLSLSGQLTVLDTNRDIPSSPDSSYEGPELLHVQKSHEMDLSYRDSSKKNDRIVSFDWVTLPSESLSPRVLVLRENGAFDILEQPANTADYVYKLVPWQAPHRGLEEGAPYHSLMKFEAPQSAEILAPLLVEQALSQMPIFGNGNGDIDSALSKLLKLNTPAAAKVEHVGAADTALPASFYQSSTIARKLKILRAFVNSEFDSTESINENLMDSIDGDFSALSLAGRNNISLASNNLGSCQDFHEALLSTLTTADDLPPDAHCVIDHAMIYRAKERYLLDPATNRNVTSDDVWTRFIWDWITDADAAAKDGGMVTLNADLSFLGVHSIWMTDLGRNPSSRLSSGTPLPDDAQWERILGVYCKKRRLPKFDGVATHKPHHRQLCLEICTWGDPDKYDPYGPDQEDNLDLPTAVHTMAAARVLFKGNTKQAIHILKTASTAHPELLFVSLALQLMGRGGTKQNSKERLDFDGAVASKTDPYLRAISAIIATGDWSVIANQRSLPLADRAYVAVRNFSDEALTAWLRDEVALARMTGDIEAIVLTGITDDLVDVFAQYVQKFNDFQTATLVLSLSYPRYLDDIRCRAWRNAYRAYLQRHRLFFQRTKFEVESTKRSKRDGIPTLKPPSRQIALRCVYCDAETSLARHQQHSATAGGVGGGGPAPPPTASSALETRNPLLATSINAGISCPNCGRHLPRCVVCLEVVGIPRSDKPEDKEETRMAGRFPTFCLRCEHVLHLDHARQWFARHTECPVPECRCRCNFRANPELDYH
ncbi:hypothetical protein B0I35DRAFT_345500 [Stachybotrys elegans]|uniref:Uncharacterized protein n=1 Tax=Stachybotrys elegans TaxID=80388 RepID=A0A8K0SZV6_9HYPO|nr:hypothetical protein B0I35DRAFT_345500 [Stachybotrys elegans]